jgi:hypothetical protein
MTRSLLIASAVIISTSILASACTEEELPQDTSSACEDAAAHINECFGTELTGCTEDLAQQLLGQSCEEIAGSVEPARKADGGFCPGWLWWLCGDTIESQFSCESAGSNAGYDTWPAAERMAYHWSWIQCTEYGVDGNPGAVSSGWRLLLNSAQGISTSILSLDRPFTNNTDMLDEGRVKMLHPFGVMAQVVLSPVEPEEGAQCVTGYTGIFEDGPLEGLARLSWGADTAAGYIPGIAIKFFIDGQSSVNVHLIHGLDPSDEPNFFEVSLTNSLPDPRSTAIRALAAYFGLFADNPLHLRLDHLARTHTDGTLVPSEDHVAPYRLTFEPTAEAQFLYGEALRDDPDVQLAEAFAQFEPGTALYEVNAQATEDGCSQHIGSLSVTTRFIAAAWGDQHLHFQHATEGQGL